MLSDGHFEGIYRLDLPDGDDIGFLYPEECLAGKTLKTAIG